MDAEELERIGLIAIIRAPRSADIAAAARALQAGGVRALEVSLTTPDALDWVGVLRRVLGDGIRVGVGTVLNGASAAQALAAGAQFIVTPTLEREAVTVCRAASTPIVCGAMTPTEALAAHTAGADYVKLFPAEALGPAFVRAVLAPLPFLKLVPTGGVTVENIGAWFAAGCRAVAVGGALLDRSVLERGDWGAVESAARRFTDAVAAARPGGLEP